MIRYLLFMWLFTSYSAPTFACSSCGSGGNDPLILYPTDQTRVYLGATRTSYASNVNGDGEDVSVVGIKQRQTTLCSVGQRLSDQSFITVAVPRVTNVGQEEQMSGVGDPIVSFRYTALRQNMLNPTTPQLQVLAGLKPKYARSTREAEDQKEFLDSFGSGYTTVRTGLDLWSGMTKVQYGLGYNLVYSLPEQYESETVQAGLQHMYNLTVGYTIQKVRAVTGIVRTYREENLVDHQRVEQSDSLQHNYFFTMSYRPVPAHEGRFTYVNQGRIASNRNTTSGNTFTAAYVYTL